MRRPPAKTRSGAARQVAAAALACTAGRATEVPDVGVRTTSGSVASSARRRRRPPLGLITRAALGRHREEIDALNVYPVPDGDTGTNLYLTVDAALDAVAAHGAHDRQPASRDRRDLARDAAPGGHAARRPRQLRGDPQPARAGALRGRRPERTCGRRGRPDPGPRAAAGQRPGAGERRPARSRAPSSPWPRAAAAAEQRPPTAAAGLRRRRRRRGAAREALARTPDSSGPAPRRRRRRRRPRAAS